MSHVQLDEYSFKQTFKLRNLTNDILRDVKVDWTEYL